MTKKKRYVFFHESRDYNVVKPVCSVLIFTLRFINSLRSIKGRKEKALLTLFLTLWQMYSTVVLGFVLAMMFSCRSVDLLQLNIQQEKPSVTDET